MARAADGVSVRPPGLPGVIRSPGPRPISADREAVDDSRVDGLGLLPTAGATATMVSMPPATGPALIILVAFVLPGFVTVLLQERTFKSADDPTPLDRLLRIIVFSVLSYF